MQDFRKLNIWYKAIEIAELTYALSKELPNDEKYGLISQMKRASISISSNIAEGAGRNSVKEFRHFVAIAQGSCFELISQTVLCQKLNLSSNDLTKKVIDESEHLAKMISAFSNKLSDKNSILITQDLLL